MRGANKGLQFGAILLASASLSGCKSTSIDKQLAVTHGLNPNMAIEAPDGGCRPEIENLVSSTGIDFVSGGSTCFATLVINSPRLSPGEMADLEIVYFNHDGIAINRSRALEDLERSVYSTSANTHLFSSRKVRIRIVARRGFSVRGNKTTGHTTQYQGDNYIDVSAHSIATLINSLDRKGSAKNFIVNGTSGGAQEILNAVTKYGHLFPKSVRALNALAPWGDIGQARSSFGYPFTNAIEPEKYLSGIPDEIQINIVASSSDSVTGTRGAVAITEKARAAGKQNVNMILYKSGISHLEIERSNEVFNDNILVQMMTILNGK